jgi:acyl-coenzyme A synthetase/AMP-(fatty) acid ligase
MNIFNYGIRKTALTILALASALQFGAIAMPAAEAAKAYQVTGPIVELTDKLIVVQKGEDRWEIAREAGTKSDSALKVGDKVTIYYTMHATKIESKGDKPERKKKK